MRPRSALLSLCIAAAALAGLLVASNASAAKRPSRVALKITVTGFGTIRVPGSHPFTCRSASTTAITCHETVHIRKGRRIAVKASPATGWKLTTWAGACHGSAATCSLRLKARRSIAVTFVPPGDRLNPYPLGTAVTVNEFSNEGNWRMTVNSATINANSQVEAVNGNVPPPAGAQYTLVNFSLTYVGGGSSYLGNFIFDYGQLNVEGAHNAAYGPDECTPPPPDIGNVGTVYSGQTETGNLCYVIAANDASTLMVSASAYINNTDQTIWFSLS